MGGQIAEASLEIGAAEVVKLPFGALASQLAGARRDCEALRQNIRAVQRSLKTLEGLLGGFPGPAREGLQGQMAYLNELLPLRLDQLSRTDRLL